MLTNRQSHNHSIINALDRLVSVDDGHGLTRFIYDPVGVLTSRALPNGVTTDYDYNLRYQLTGVTHSNSSGTLQSFTYQLDDAGNRLGVTEQAGNTIAWDYDDAYHLTSERRYSPVHILLAETIFTYDDMGNRLTETTAGATTHYAYNNLDQLLGTCDAEWDGTACTGYDTAYSYDGRGNLAQTVEGTQTTTFTFDAADRLAGVVMPNTTQVAFAYDADGQRISQTADGQSINYLWDAYSAYGDVLLETDGSGAPLAGYTLANGQIIAQTRGGVPTYYLSDGQGNTRALADESGAITDTYDYTAFGELVAQSGSSDNNYLYTGQQFDEMTGLYSLRARYYNPALGRFLNQDTAGILFSNPIELNRYGYTANNPINYSDPSGHGLVDTAITNYKAFRNTRQGAGTIGGAAFGGMGAFVIYFMASTNACGPVMYDWASRTNPAAFAPESMKMGAIMGYAIGGLPTMGVAAMSLAGTVAAGAAFKADRNLCTAAILTVAAVGTMAACGAGLIEGMGPISLPGGGGGTLVTDTGHTFGGALAAETTNVWTLTGTIVAVVAAAGSGGSKWSEAELQARREYAEELRRNPEGVKHGNAERKSNHVWKHMHKDGTGKPRTWEERVALVRGIVKNSEAVYVSESGDGNLVFLYKENIVVVQYKGSGRGNALTAYGPTGIKAESGATALGGLPGEQGHAITHEMIINGRIPGYPNPATQIFP